MLKKYIEREIAMGVNNSAEKTEHNHIDHAVSNIGGPIFHPTVRVFEGGYLKEQCHRIRIFSAHNKKNVRKLSEITRKVIRGDPSNSQLCGDRQRSIQDSR